MPRVTLIDNVKSTGVKDPANPPPMARRWPMVELEEALTTRWPADQYITMYTTPDGYRANGGCPDVTWSCMFVDVDNVPHEEWEEDKLEIMIDRFCVDESLADWGVYFTRRGLRMFRPLAETITNHADMKNAIKWVHESLWREHRIRTDRDTRDTGRLFRAPWCGLLAPVWCRLTANPLHIDLATLAKKYALDPNPTPELLVPSRLISDNRLLSLANLIQSRQRGTRHSIALSMAGAFLTAGYERAEVERIFRVIFKGEREFSDSMKTVQTTADRIASNLAVVGLSSLPERHRSVIKHLLSADNIVTIEGPKMTKQQAIDGMLAHCMDPPPGVSILMASCGLGKTETARAVAHDRADAGKRTGFTFPTNALCIENMDRLLERGLRVRRLYSPQSTGECHYPGAAAAISSAGLSVTLELCKGRTPAGRCKYYDTCTAKDGAEGPEDAEVLIAPHQLIRSVAERSTAIFVDEPPEVLTESKPDLDALSRAIGWFDPSCRYAVDHSIAWLRANQQLPGIHRFPPPISTDGGPAILGNEGTHAPKLTDACLWKMREDDAFAATIGRGAKLWSLLYGQAYHGVAVALRDGMILYPFEQLIEVVRTHARVVLLDANGDIRQPAYEKVTGSTVPLARFNAPDGAPIHRVMWPMRVNKTSWETDRPAVLAIWEQVKSALKGQRVGVITLKAIREVIECDEFQWLHYGNEKGSDVMKDCDTVVTFGDFIENLDALNFWCEYLGIKDRRKYIDAVTKSHLEQACGRLRPIHRVKKGCMLHVGKVVPGGWSDYIILQEHTNLVENLLSVESPS